MEGDFDGFFGGFSFSVDGELGLCGGLAMVDLGFLTSVGLRWGLGGDVKQSKLFALPRCWKYSFQLA